MIEALCWKSGLYVKAYWLQNGENKRKKCIIKDIRIEKPIFFSNGQI
jgi:hypothetical protein